MSDRTSHIPSGQPDSGDRLIELLIDRETDSLSPERERELAQLLKAHPAAEQDIVRAVSAGAAASVPPALTAKLVAAATGYFAAGGASAAGATAASTTSIASAAAVALPAAKSSAPWILWSGWAIAAAAAIAVTVAFSTGYLRTQRTTKPITGRAPAEVLAMATEVDRATDTTKATFTPGSGDFAGGYGSVVFSPSLQRGYLRISGLPLNEAKKMQYQLWAVDATRGTFAVDCGVFDMNAECDLIVPFTPKLPLKRPDTFVVTREPAGGVVVSQSPLRLTAPVSR